MRLQHITVEGLAPSLPQPTNQPADQPANPVFARTHTHPQRTQPQRTQPQRTQPQRTQPQRTQPMCTQRSRYHHKECMMTTSSRLQPATFTAPSLPAKESRSQGSQGSQGSQEAKEAKEAKEAREAKEPRKPRRKPTGQRANQRRSKLELQLDQFGFVDHLDLPEFDEAFSPRLLSAINQLGFTHPTPIQTTVAQTIRENVDRKPIIVGAQTGSGKTLAYALPMIDEILHQNGCGLIVTPGKELSQQVVPRAYDQMSQLGNPDIVVTTDSTLKTIDLSPFVGHLKYLVVDEFDAVFSGAESSYMWSALREIAPNSLKKSYLQRQRAMRMGITNDHPSVSDVDNNVTKAMVIFSGATLPDRGLKSVMSSVSSRLAPHLVLSAPKLHAPVDRLVQMFDFNSVTKEVIPPPRPIIDTTPIVKAIHSSLRHLWEDTIEKNRAMSPSSQTTVVHTKEGLVTQYVKQALQQNAATLIFCNTVDSTDHLYSHLQQLFPEDIAVLHKKVAPQQRHHILDAFKNGDVKVICCTDILARGIDLKVDLIIQADFAQDVISYLHRIGRTARNGRHGCAIAIVGDENLALAKEVVAHLDSTRAQRWHAWRVDELEIPAHAPASSGDSTIPISPLSSLFSRNRSARKRRKRADDKN
eukprot:gene8223-820_t